ncbi:MAG: TrkA family potassium uptake protein [Dehalococcoidia bacterium]
MKQQVAVIGLGRFGSAVAIELVRLGHDVLGVDSDMNAVQRLSNQLSHVVQADAIDEETLTRLGVGDFDAAIVGITESLETSILATLMLKRLGVPRVVVKARNETHGDILARVGADRVVYPERDTGVRLAHSWTSTAITDSLDVIEGYAVSKVAVPALMVGKTIGEAMATGDFQMALLLLARGPRVTVYPNSDTQLREGDVLVIGGELSEMERFFATLATG